jgi:aminopeptidase N
VRELMRDSAFTLQNPNKVRSLIGTFSSVNPLRFHASDGSGYEFLADRVLELDAINPQVAARLLTPMGRWRRHDAGRQEKMKAQLQRILDHEGLSKDSFEIARKSLG